MSSSLEEMEGEREDERANRSPVAQQVYERGEHLHVVGDFVALSDGPFLPTPLRDSFKLCLLHYMSNGTQFRCRDEMVNLEG